MTRERICVDEERRRCGTARPAPGEEKRKKGGKFEKTGGRVGRRQHGQWRDGGEDVRGLGHGCVGMYLT